MAGYRLRRRYAGLSWSAHSWRNTLHGIISRKWWKRAKTKKLGAFIALGDNDKRREAAKRIEKAGWHAAVFVHTEAYLARDAQLGEGCVIGPLSTISPNVSIGRYALVATRTSIGHHAAIGDFAQIAVGASVLGYANIGTGAMIGTNAAVLPGIKVGAWATVAACTPAMTHVKAGTTICLPLARTIFKRDRLPDDDTESGV